MIPKIIHQTWKTETIPERWKDAVDSCKKIHKGYRYILWTHQTMRKFVRKFYPDFYPTYRDYTYDIQRCDAFRYLVLYKYGGIYLDLDLVCKKKLNDLLHYDLVFIHSNSEKRYFRNSFYMTIPKHPFIKFCIDALPKHIYDSYYFGKHWHIMNSTGPIFLTNRIMEYGKISKVRFLTKAEFEGDCNYCNLAEGTQGLDTCEGGEYFKPIIGQSWNGIDTQFYNLAYCHSTEIVAGLLLATLIGSEYYYWSSSIYSLTTQSDHVS